MKNAVFWDVAPCRSCPNRRFGGTYRLHLQGRNIRERKTPAQAGSSLMNFSTLKMEAIRSSETSVHTGSTRRHIPEDATINEASSYLHLYVSIYGSTALCWALAAFSVS
jgi:hypothetical protein